MRSVELKEGGSLLRMAITVATSIAKVGALRAWLLIRRNCVEMSHQVWLSILHTGQGCGFRTCAPFEAGSIQC